MLPGITPGLLWMDFACHHFSLQVVGRLVASLEVHTISSSVRWLPVRGKEEQRELRNKQKLQEHMSFGLGCILRVCEGEW